MKRRALRSRLASLVALGFLLALAGDARAATSFLDAATSSDVDVDLAGTTFRDEDVPVRPARS